MKPVAREFENLLFLPIALKVDLPGTVPPPEGKGSNCNPH